jgi:hypothetical protein
VPGKNRQILIQLHTIRVPLAHTFAGAYRPPP